MDDVRALPPVFPWSLTCRDSVILSVALLAVVNCTLPAAINAFRLVAFPVSVNAEVLPPTLTPLPLAALSAPLAAFSVSTRLLLPASLSASVMPVIDVAMSSVTLMVVGTVTVGASFTATMVVPMVLLVLAIAVLPPWADASVVTRVLPLVKLPA